MVDKRVDLEDKIVCLNQFFRPKRTDYSCIEGCGDCSTCTYDEQNKYCQRNKPIKIKVFYVNSKE